MNKIKFIPSTILLFIKIYFIVIGFFTLFRVILFFTEIGRINESVSNSDIFLSFVMGLRFDIVISGYLLLLPYTILIIISFFKHNYKIINKIASYYICIIFSIAFLVCAIDIPYFNQFFARFSITAFEWLDNPVFVLKMIVQEPRYWWILLPFVLFIYLFIKIIKKILSDYSYNSIGNIIPKVIMSLFFGGCIVLGIRGRIEEKSPIRVGTAFFSNNAFLNQLGLNPNFTLIRSYLDSQKDENKSIKLIDDNFAITNVQKYLGIITPDKDSPLLRKITFDSTNAVKYNVVIIIMESMSAAKMGIGLTPFLDSISEKGYRFSNAYTAGIHTFNGIYSSLFSFPALFRQQPMKESSAFKYHSIFSILKENGYSTIFFIPHDGQFDNVEGFLKANDCEVVISKPNYPSNRVKTTLGVPDDFMFEFSIPILNQLYNTNKPFFASFMTASDHGPYYIPEYFKPTKKGIKNQITEYADFALRKFIDLSSKQKWFKNTIFVFVADHGAP
ncbi:MAG: sulfatase-like hydrolase/transferase, partial [Bacteroidetes bacterium]|nr:sulfatase-like hydrolase/transferase [Bacteroidota bacterium]